MHVISFEDLENASDVGNLIKLFGLVQYRGEPGLFFRV